MFIGILILIPVMIAVLFFLITEDRKPAFHENQEGTGEIVSADIPASPTPVEIIPPTFPDLVTELETGIQTIQEEGLLMLADEENALGYYSNLVLAARKEKAGKEASGYYRSALALYPSSELQLKLASLLFQEGKTEEAEKEYLLILPEDTAMQALAQINTNPEKISEALFGKKAWKALTEYLKPIIDSDSEQNENASLLRHYAIALAEQGEFKQAFPFFKKLYALESADSQVAWYYGRCLEATGQGTSAEKIYDAIGEKGAYRRGIILQKRGKTAEAAEAFAASKEGISLWQAARIWDAAGDIEKAVDAYTRAADTTSSYQDDAAYRAYILDNRLGKTNTDKLLMILSKYPAWMARLNLEPEMPDLHEVAYDKPEYLNRVELYEKDGYADAAAVELAIGTKNTDIGEKLALGDWYLARGEYYNAIAWGIRSLNEKPTKKGYTLAYPKAFEELVLAAAEKYHVESELIWAVMREESHCRYDAVSRAGAMGLMQIMPPTGKDIASRLGEAYTDNDLLIPETSIRFGVFYIESMLRMFEGDIDKALAAYNGGGGNVKKWMESNLGTTDEDFPTAITFPETQEYITKVTNSYYIYQWLYQ